jgi:hypothetical protein
MCAAHDEQWKSIRSAPAEAGVVPGGDSGGGASAARGTRNSVWHFGQRARAPAAEADTRIFVWQFLQRNAKLPGIACDIAVSFLLRDVEAPRPSYALGR